jgi:hypothetical protein
LKTGCYLTISFWPENKFLRVKSGPSWGTSPSAAGSVRQCPILFFGQGGKKNVEKINKCKNDIYYCITFIPLIV